MNEKDRLQALADSITEIRQRGSGVKGEEKELLAAAKKEGVHPAAFGLALRLSKIDARKSAEFLRSLETYCDALGLYAQADLFTEKRKPKAAAPDPAEKPAKPQPTQVGFDDAGDASGTYGFN